VNNQFRSYSQDVYRTEFVKLLHTAIEYAGGNKQRVFVISIPDWSVTPYAEGRDREKIATEIAQFNIINKAEAAKEGIAYINITPSSQKAAADVSLLAKDGLHPSAKMYKLWVDELAPMVKQHLNQ
jgi:lysophospholipase L1-like esterase